jgi:hypothetical protein
MRGGRQINVDHPDTLERELPARQLDGSQGRIGA